MKPITIAADDLDRVAAFLARILPDEIDEADRAALERFAAALDGIHTIGPLVVFTMRSAHADHDGIKSIRRKVAAALFPEPSVIGPDGAAHPARSRR
jgi:hypothetical protein